LGSPLPEPLELEDPEPLGGPLEPLEPLEPLNHLQAAEPEVENFVKKAEPVSDQLRLPASPLKRKVT